ncbi:MAG: hypothetical protein A4E55_02423 [Pelotomaculum sp. PtaU1.Bin035]|nr:MAG: hypothetical protein A4E55_02423 [Pelotomaculum sp. PtaU1.Bin035]
MSFCSDCGAKVEAGAKFCENCGYVLDARPAAPLSSFKISKFYVKIAIAAVLVLILVVFLSSTLGKSNIVSAYYPESVAKAFVEGAVKGDKSVERLCAGDDTDRVFNMGVMALGLSMTKDRNFTYKTTKKTESKAMVQVSGSSGHLCDIELEYSKGKWLVSCVY